MRRARFQDQLRHGATTAFLFLLTFGLAVGPLNYPFAQEVFAQEKPAQEKPAPSDASDASPFEEGQADQTDFTPKSASAVALLATEPKTPEAIARVALILAEMDEPGPARKLLGQLIEANLDEVTLADLGQRLTAAPFARLKANQAIAPEGAQLAEAVLAAVENRLRSPERINRLIGQLAEASEDQRARAVAGLREAGPAAVGPLLTVLADSDQKELAPQVRMMLDYLGRDALGPLVGALQSPEPRLRVEAIGVLAELGTDLGAKNRALYLLGAYASPESPAEVRQAARTALRKMVGRQPSQDQVFDLLIETTRNYLDGRVSLPVDVDGNATVWTWDAEKNTPVATAYPAPQAATRIALRLAADALSIDPSNETARQLYLVTLLQLAGQTSAWDAPLELSANSPAARASEFGVGPLRTAMETALRENRVPAAIAAAKIFERLGPARAKAILAADKKNQPAPLVRAVRAADRRLRFVACEAIMNLNPQKPFPGASYVTESIVFLASATGANRAMVAGGNNASNRRIAGFLAERQWEVDRAITGREMMEKLTARADYTLVYVDTTILKPLLPLLMQAMRQDGRTAALGVGLVGLEDQLAQARRTAEVDPLVLVLPPPADAEGIDWQIEKLTGLSARGIVSSEARLMQAVRAIGWLGRLAEARGKVFPLRGVQEAAARAALLPDLTRASVRILQNRPTATAQVQLVDMASRTVLPLEIRQIALAGFENHVAENGILLTTDQILLQFDRYNASANLDQETQKILSRILDCLEGKNAKK